MTEAEHKLHPYIYSNLQIYNVQAKYSHIHRYSIVDLYVGGD